MLGRGPLEKDTHLVVCVVLPAAENDLARAALEVARDSYEDGVGECAAQDSSAELWSFSLPTGLPEEEDLAPVTHSLSQSRPENASLTPRSLPLSRRLAILWVPKEAVCLLWHPCVLLASFCGGAAEAPEHDASVSAKKNGD